MNDLTIALFAGFSGMIGWGISDFFAKKTIDKIGSLKTLIGAQILGGTLLLLYFLYTQNTVPTITLATFSSIIILATLDAVAYGLLFQAYKKGIVSIVSPIGASAAGVSVLVAVLLFGEILSTASFFGIVLLCFGIILTSIDFNDLQRNFSRKNLLGQGIPEAVGAMIVFGLWFPLWDTFVENRDWLFWLMMLKLVTGILLVIVFYITNKEKVSLQTGYAGVIMTLVAVGILDTFAYFGTTWGYSVTTNTTSLITVISHAYSLPTILLAYLFLKERTTKTQMFGIVSIIGGILTISSL